MNRIFLIIGFLLPAVPAAATDEVDRMVEAVAALESSETDLQAYCEIIATPVPEGDAVAQEHLDTNIDAFYQERPPYSALADLEVEDARLEAAFNRLEQKCSVENVALPDDGNR
jgi:uncharacterized protein YbaA (DUF1428 family)